MSMCQQITLPSNVVIAIPAYRAENELRTFLPHLLKFIEASQIVILIDGLLDNTQSYCDELGIRTIIHLKNQGKGAALTTLFSQLSQSYSWIITMDADGQHSPEDLSSFISAIESSNETCAVFAGSRNRKGTAMPILRRFSNGSTSRFLSLVTKQTILDSQCGYRAYRSSALKKINCRFTRFEMESEILIRATALGFSIANVPVSTVYNGGPSHISHIKDTFRWIRAVLTTLLSIHKQKGSA